jgi:hypothetical protein
LAKTKKLEFWNLEFGTWNLNVLEIKFQSLKIKKKRIFGVFFGVRKK